MKKYIKPECEIIDVLMENHILQMSEVHDEEGNGIWLAPEKNMESTSFWE